MLTMVFWTLHRIQVERSFKNLIQLWRLQVSVSETFPALAKHTNSGVISLSPTANVIFWLFLAQTKHKFVIDILLFMVSQ